METRSGKKIPTKTGKSAGNSSAKGVYDVYPRVHPIHRLPKLALALRRLQRYMNTSQSIFIVSTHLRVMKTVTAE